VYVNARSKAPRQYCSLQNTENLSVGSMNAVHPLEFVEIYEL